MQTFHFYLFLIRMLIAIKKRLKKNCFLRCVQFKTTLLMSGELNSILGFLIRIQSYFHYADQDTFRKKWIRFAGFKFLLLGSVAGPVPGLYCAPSG